MVRPIELLSEGDAEWLDRYQLVGELATGGMATVYLARLPGVGGFSRQVAIKRLHPHLAKDPDFVEMFLDEARLAARIHHPNVVAISEIGATESGFYLVMDYIEGVTLARLLTHAATTSSALAVPTALRITVDTLNGLHAAHELTGEDGESLGVVHRDCSPQNILVGIDGTARLTDFGIARAASRIADTRDGAMKGKLAYMAPEQTQDGPLDRRADIFSVGVVLWESLAQRRLFKGASEAETLRRVLVEPIPRLRQVAPELHAAFEDVCERALARDPAERFPTALAMVDALEDAAREWGRDAKIEEPLSVARSVASDLSERFGAQLTEQRELLRRWLQASPSNPGLPLARPTDRGWLAASLAGRFVHEIEFGDRPTSAIPPPVTEDATQHYDSERRAVIARAAGLERGTSEHTPGPTAEPTLADTPRPPRLGLFAIGAVAALVATGALAYAIRPSRVSSDAAQTRTAAPGGDASVAGVHPSGVPNGATLEADTSRSASSRGATDRRDGARENADNSGEIVIPSPSGASASLPPQAPSSASAEADRLMSGSPRATSTSSATAPSHADVPGASHAGPSGASQATTSGAAPAATPGTSHPATPSADAARPSPSASPRQPADDDLANPYR